MNQSNAFEVGPVVICCSCYRSEFSDDRIGAEEERGINGDGSMGRENGGKRARRAERGCG